MLAVRGASAEIGVHAVEFILVEDWQFVGSGTLAVTAIDIGGMSHADYTLEGTLELDGGGWMLSGPLAIYGCDRLDVFAP